MGDVNRDGKISLPEANNLWMMLTAINTAFISWHLLANRMYR